LLGVFASLKGITARESAELVQLRKEREEAEEIVEKFYTNISSIASSPTKGTRTRTLLLSDHRSGTSDLPTQRSPRRERGRGGGGIGGGDLRMEGNLAPLRSSKERQQGGGGGGGVAEEDLFAVRVLPPPPRRRPGPSGVDRGVEGGVNEGDGHPLTSQEEREGGETVKAAAEEEEEAVRLERVTAVGVVAGGKGGEGGERERVQVTDPELSGAGGGGAGGGAGSGKGAEGEGAKGRREGGGGVMMFGRMQPWKVGNVGDNVVNVRMAPRTDADKVGELRSDVANVLLMCC
jgi:hypothetical protein